MTKVNYRPLTKKERRVSEHWVLYIANSMEMINTTVREVFDIVHQLNQHSAKHAMQIRTLKKRWMKQVEINKDLEKRIYTLEMGRSRFDGV